MNISRDNYEGFMVAYIDRELNAVDLKSFELFIANNPDLKEELDAYAGLQFVSNEDVIFEDKEVLLKKESAFILWRNMWSVAAAILLAIAIIPFIKSDNRIEDNAVVKTVEPKKTINPKKKIEPEQREAVVRMDEVEQVTAPVQTRSKKVQKGIVKQAIVKQPVLKKKGALVKKEQEQIVPSKEPLEVPLKEIIVQEKKSNNKPEPKNYLPEAKKKLKNVIVQMPATPTNELTTKAEGRGNLITISEERNPLIHEKLNNVVMKVEDRINQIKTIKKTPITVCIGKRKIFTLNN